MVYKKYIYRNGKKFGPYYFKSVRGKDGSIKSIYLGKKNPKFSNSLIVMIFLAVIFVSFFGYFSYQGFMVADLESPVEELKIDQKDEISNIAQPEERQDDKTIESNPDTEVEVSDDEIVESNDQVELVKEEEIYEAPLEIENRRSNSQKEPIFNISNNTIENGNISFPLNSSSDFFENETAVLNNSTSEVEYFENESIIEENFEEQDFLGEVPYQINEYPLEVKVGEEVRWVKHIIFNEPSKNFELILPENANNLVVIEESYFENKKKTKSMDSITAEVVYDFDVFSSKIFNFFKNLFSFTGFVTLENRVVLEDNLKEVKIEYSLPGPELIKEHLGNGITKVSLSSNINYTNITIEYPFEDLPVNSKINLFDSSGESVSYRSLDLDGDEKIDYISWVSPLLNETYFINILVLNFQSFPMVGGNWTVEFNTTGVADLKIYPINGTTWGTSSSENDLKFLEIRCRDNNLDYVWENNSILVSNYSCNATGYETSYVRSEGGHYLEFDFGGIKAQARNSASCGDTISSDTVLDGDVTGCSGSYALILSSAASDYTLDCDGHTISCDGGTADGIVFSNVDNVTVKNCIITNCEYGFLSWGGSKNMTILNNTIHSNSQTAVYPYGPVTKNEDIHVINNTIYSNNRGIYLYVTDNSNVTGNVIYGHANENVYLRGASNNFLYNNQIYTSAQYGIRIYDSSYNNTISSNTIRDNRRNIYLSSNNIQGNIMRDNQIYNSQDTGISFFGTTVSFNEIINNTIYNNSLEGIALGRWTSFAGSYNKIINNTIFNHSAQRGIFLVATNTTIEGNSLYNNYYNGLYVYTGSHFTNISNNKIYDNVAEGLTIVGSNYNNVFDNNLSSNPTIGLYVYSSDNVYVKNNIVHDNWESSSYGGAVLLRASDEGLYENNSFVGSGDMGIRVYGCSNNTFRNNIFANFTDYSFFLGETDIVYNHSFYGDTFERLTSTIGLAVRNAYNTKLVDVKFSGPGNNIQNHPTLGNYTTLLNVSWDQVSFSDTHIYYLKWWLDLNVTASDLGIEDANVSVYDNEDNLIFTELTNSSGWIDRKNLTEAIIQASNYEYFTNYTINVTSPSSLYSNKSEQLNLTTNKQINIVLESLNSAPGMTNISILPVNPNTSNDLIGFCNASDDEEDTLNYYYRWYLDGELNQSGNVSGFEQGSLVNIHNLSYLNTSKNQNWTLSCLANDGMYNASGWINFSVVIGNSPPNISSSRIDPGPTAYTNQSLVGYCNGSDVDLEDQIYYYYKWYLNDTLFTEGISSQGCSEGHTNNGDGTCTAILRPNANGDLNEFPTQVPDSGNHYDKVDDDPLDEDNTFVGGQGGGALESYVLFKENGIISNFSLAEPTASYVENNYLRTTRPSDNGIWTIDDVNALQIGFAEFAVTTSNELYNIEDLNIGNGSIINSVNVYAVYKSISRPALLTRLTQMYAEINYTPANLSYSPGVEVNVANVSYLNTLKGENWTLSCLANDGISNASEWANYSTNILNTPPSIPELIYPENGGHLTNRSPVFNWSTSIDGDGDSLEYHFVLDLDSDFDPVEYEREPPANGVAELYHNPDYTFNIDVPYFWKVRAYDGESFSGWSEVFNFTIDSVVDIILNQAQVDFGSLGPGDIKNTTNESYNPFVIENSGNVMSNISINATSLFGSVNLNTNYYQFKANNYTGEENSFNESSSIIDWTNVPDNPLTFIGYLNYLDNIDSAAIDILVRIPESELKGDKLSEVTFFAEIAE